MRPRIIYLLIPDHVPVGKADNLDTETMKAYVSKKKAQTIQHFFWKKGYDLTILRIRFDHIGFVVKKKGKKK